MRILTWNVNVLRTCLDYHPFSSMEKRNVEGLLDTLGAQIACFQEHKTRRAQLEKSYACPGPYDAFWTFPRSKTGYSGVCTFVDSRLCVPLKAEEGITGLLLDDKASTMKPPWKMEERLGCYPDHDEMRYLDEEGVAFDPKRLDMEGRAVVCDFGLFVLFNLYSPNETNETRRPYKMNFLACLQERVKLLLASGKEVIVVGDLNIMRAPIDSGEGGIRTSAEQHYEHPARVILNDWIAPRGPMIDVVRESWPEREDMFTCWNQKLDARPSNYGSRIDYVLCSEGLRPWIKGGDIDNKIFGSDHCPVYIDLHDEIDDPANPGQTLYLRDALNPPDRPPCTAPVYPQDPPRTAPEPPRFATKFYDEFSGKQRTLKSFFGGGASAKKAKDAEQPKTEKNRDKAVGKVEERGGAALCAEKGNTSNGTTGAYAPADTANRTTPANATSTTNKPSISPSTPFGIARAAFNHLDHPATPANSEAGPSRPPMRTALSGSQESPQIDCTRSMAGASMEPVEIDGDDEVQYIPSSTARPGSVSRNSSSNDNGGPLRSSTGKAVNTAKRPKTASAAGSGNGSAAVKAGQQSISSFFAAPKTKPNLKSSQSRERKPLSTPRPRASRDRSLSSTTVDLQNEYTDLPPPLSPPHTLATTNSTSYLAKSRQDTDPPDPERDAAIAAALAASEAEEEASRAAKKAEQAPIWNNLFAKKAAPLCTVHGKPCKVFTSKVVGPNKNKRFWLCSLPVGPGYDSGRSKRKREDVNPHFRCDL